MEQAEADKVGFHEVDQDGKPTDPGATSGDHNADGTKGAGWTGFNPFIAILWILAATLVVGGIWGFANAFSGPTSSSGTMPLGFMLVNFAPQAVLSGTLAIMSLLFWHAVQWQRARR